ncbi:unnamed protein product, partial [Rotaria sp. Silwood1]
FPMTNFGIASQDGYGPAAYDPYMVFAYGGRHISGRRSRHGYGTMSGVPIQRFSRGFPRGSGHNRGHVYAATNQVLAGGGNNMAAFGMLAM